MTTPQDAEYYLDGCYFKIGRFGMPFRWIEDGIYRGWHKANRPVSEVIRSRRAHETGRRTFWVLEEMEKPPRGEV